MEITRRSALNFLLLTGVEAASLGAAGSASAKTSFNLGRRAAGSPHGLKVEWREAPLGIDTKRPRFSWRLDANDSRERDVIQSAWRVIVASSKDRLRRGRADIWDSGKVNGSALRAAPNEDLPLKSQTSYWWIVKTWIGEDEQSRDSLPAPFVTGVLEGDWRAQWIAAIADGPRESLPPAAGFHAPVAPTIMPVFRKAFTLKKRVRQAIVCVTGLGQYELQVNGEAVSKGVLAPGWTNYSKTILYNTYDVTRLVRKGANLLRVMLGNGMYNVERYPGRYTKFVGSFGQPKLILQLKLIYEDGEEELVASDASWSTRPGPIILSSIYGGEDFDARRDATDHDADADEWSPVKIVEGAGGRLRAQSVPLVEPSRSFEPISVSEPKPGVFVYDFGVNFSGWPKLKVSGPAGAAVRLLPGELLDENGLVTQRSMGARPDMAVVFQYTLAGRGKEEWRPRFSYTGFRYVQVEGATPKRSAARGASVLHSLEGVFLHNAMANTGRFNTSDPLFARIHRIIRQALLSNTFSVLTDCPHREKLGWLEQTYLNADTVFCNEDAVTLYEKMTVDIADSQLANGMVPGHAPEYVAFIKKNGEDEVWRNSPEWGAACVFSPWATYRYYGDQTVLRAGYPAMARYADYLQGRLQGGLIDFGMGDWYDIGPNPPGVAQLTSKSLTGTATYCGMLMTLAKIAAVLDRDGDAASYAARAIALRETFNAKLFDRATARYDRGSQTAQAMPLVFDLVPEGFREKVLENLISAIRDTNYHVSAGDVGFHYVVRALMEAGRADVLYKMLSCKTAPSYAAQLARGATSLTEAWDANPNSSQNHFMLGHAETWFYRGLAGVNVDMSAEAQIKIAPQVITDVTAAAACCRTVFGDVASVWRKRAGELFMHIVIPANTRARIVLPCGSANAIRENERPLARSEGLSEIASDGQATRLLAGSGRYDFAMPAA